MEPEIARRCKSCGAAIRPRSAFCPQCGISVAVDGAKPAPANASPAATESPQSKPADSAQLAETIAPTTMAETPAQAQAPVQMEAAAPDGVRGKDTAAAVPGAPVESPALANTIAPGTLTPSDADAAGKQPRVATAKAREFVDDNMRPRAEKLRRASNVVLDEAAADPSLRFVLVATVLIVLSLLILLLGRIL